MSPGLEPRLGGGRVGLDGLDVGPRPDRPGPGRGRRAARSVTERLGPGGRVVGRDRRASRSCAPPPARAARPRRSSACPRSRSRWSGSRIGSKSSWPSTLTIRSPLRNPACSAGEPCRMRAIGSIASRTRSRRTGSAATISLSCFGDRPSSPAVAARRSKTMLERLVEIPGQEPMILLDVGQRLDGAVAAAGRPGCRRACPPA